VSTLTANKALAEILIRTPKNVRFSIGLRIYAKKKRAKVC
jgi:hypothetical protein